MISSHLPTLSGQRSLAMIFPVVCCPNLGLTREGMDRGQGGSSTPFPGVAYLNALHWALGVGVVWEMGWGAEAGILNMVPLENLS